MRDILLIGIMIILLITVIIAISSCNRGKVNESTEISEIIEEVAIDNETALEYIDAVYDIDIVKKWHSFSQTPAGSFQYFFSDINSEIPMKPLREVGDNGYYVPYKIKEGGILYLFFYTHPDNTVSSIKFRNAVYSIKILCKKDFEKISIGSSFDKVTAIDPTAEYAQVYADGTMVSDHLLTDGLIQYLYEKKGSEYTIFAINEYGINDEKNEQMNGMDPYSKILEQDRVH